MAQSENVKPEEAQKIVDEISGAISQAQEAYTAQEITLEEMIAQVREALDSAEAKLGKEEPGLGGMGMNKKMDMPEPEEMEE